MEMLIFSISHHKCFFCGKDFIFDASIESNKYEQLKPPHIMFECSPTAPYYLKKENYTHGEVEIPSTTLEKMKEATKKDSKADIGQKYTVTVKVECPFCHKINIISKELWVDLDNPRIRDSV